MNDNTFIPVSKAPSFFVDRSAASRIKKLYCYIRCFADEIDPITKQIGELEEVYLNGLFEIVDECVEDYFLSQLTDETYNPVLFPVQATINGKECGSEKREFTTAILDNDVFARTEDLESLSKHFGIPKSEAFNKDHIKSLDQIINEYSYDEHTFFLPGEEEEFDEYTSDT